MVFQVDYSQVGSTATGSHLSFEGRQVHAPLEWTSQRCPRLQASAGRYGRGARDGARTNHQSIIGQGEPGGPVLQKPDHDSRHDQRERQRRERYGIQVEIDRRGCSSGQEQNRYRGAYGVPAASPAREPFESRLHGEFGGGSFEQSLSLSAGY